MPPQTLVLLLAAAGLGLAALATLGAIFFTVQQRTVVIGASSRTNAILIPHSPGHLTSLSDQMRTAMIEADQTVRAPRNGGSTRAED